MRAFLFGSSKYYAVCFVVLFLAGGCGGGSRGKSTNTDIEWSWELVDSNPASVSHGQTVSLEDYQGKVSAWYFGKSS